MKKIKLSLILVIAIVGAFLIYKKFEHINYEQKEVDKFVSEYTLLEKNHVFKIINIDEGEQNPNHIFLDGYVCKHPVYRKTPLGREIADVLLAVNRPYGKSDYIPCICWGRNARFADQFEVGTHVQIWGRIQSREYQKKIDEEIYEKRVAYEVSVSKLEYIAE